MVGSSGNFSKLMVEKKSEYLTKWFHLMLEGYPDQTASRLKNEKNQFANPVGHNYLEGLTGIYDCLLNKAKSEDFKPFVEQIIKIKAVQDGSPSQAMAFIFILKQVIRDGFRVEIDKGRISPRELLDFESRIDDIALLAFTVYLECREKVYQLRIDEVNRNFKMLERAVYGRSAEDRPKN